MGAINNGGAAFPCEGGMDSGLYPDPGMSLRDYIAAHATEADIAAHRTAIWQDDKYLGDMTREAAKYAYADAMIAAREKGGEL